MGATDQETLENQDSLATKEESVDAPLEAGAEAPVDDVPQAAEGQETLDNEDSSTTEGESVEDPSEAGAEVAVDEVPQAAEEPEILDNEDSSTTEGESVEAPSEAGAEVAVDEAPQVVEEPEPDDGRAWFFIHTYSGYENKVKNYLDQRIETMGMQDRIFRVVVPTEDEVEIRNGQRRTTKRRIFPGYILVQMLMDDESWYAVRNTPGVTGFVGTGAKPVPLSQEEVDKILKRMETEQPRIKVHFRVGETVRIAEGPFVDFMGVVDDLYPERGKVRILVSLFGRDTPVEMDFMQVESI